MKAIRHPLIAEVALNFQPGKAERLSKQWLQPGLAHGGVGSQQREFLTGGLQQAGGIKAHRSAEELLHSGAIQLSDQRSQQIRCRGNQALVELLQQGLHRGAPAPQRLELLPTIRGLA